MAVENNNIQLYTHTHTLSLEITYVHICTKFYFSLFPTQASSIDQSRESQITKCILHLRFLFNSITIYCTSILGLSSLHQTTSMILDIMCSITFCINCWTANCIQALWYAVPFAPPHIGHFLLIRISDTHIVICRPHVASWR